MVHQIRFDHTQPQRFTIKTLNRLYEVEVRPSADGTFQVDLTENHLPVLDPDVVETVKLLGDRLLVLPDTEQRPPKQVEISFSNIDDLLLFLHLIHNFDDPFTSLKEIKEHFRNDYTTIYGTDGSITVFNKYWNIKFPTAYPEVVPTITISGINIASPEYNGNLWFPQRNLRTMIAKLYKACELYARGL